MAKLGLFAADANGWYWGVAEPGRPVGPEEFRRPGAQGIGGAWFTLRPERARGFGTEIAATSALQRLCAECGYRPDSLQVRALPESRRTSIVQDGILRVPLYHGTSNLFLESIVRLGLGGANPLEPLQVLDFLRDLVEWCDLRAEADAEFAAWWSGRRLRLEPSQLQQSRVLNFRSGRTWLTPSRRSAARHALLNAYGSEAVSEAILLYQDATAQVPGQLEDLPFAVSPVLRLRESTPSPVLVEAVGVAAADLTPEAGGEGEEAIRRLDGMWDPNDSSVFEDLTQQECFEPVRPLPASQLKFYKVIKSGEDLSLPEFTLENC